MWQNLLKIRSLRRFFSPPPSPLPPPALFPTRIQSWTTQAMGDLDIATIRLIVPIPTGVAIGSDYGLTLCEEPGHFRSFPWPEGSRRDARRIEAMAWQPGPDDRGILHFGILRSACAWNFQDPPVFRSHPPDREEGWDELACLYWTGTNLIAGYRTHMAGISGPPDVLCATHDHKTGTLYVGTRAGEVYQRQDNTWTCIKVFEDKARGIPGMRRRPVRHMVWSQNQLWLAAAEALHRFDGTSWESQGPEPTSLTVDPQGRVWAILEGQLYRLDPSPKRVDADLWRPWSLCATHNGLWVGGQGRLWHISLAP